MVKSLDDEDRNWREETEEKQKERERDGPDLYTDHIPGQKTSRPGWPPLLPFVLH
jgi:hypothetical protein